MSVWDAEFAAGGPILYFISFLLLVLPLSMFYLDFRRPKDMLPKPSKTIPKPPATRVKELRIYPIKSCRGITVPRSRLLKTGLDLDRNWMFVDASDLKFLTIRQISAMTLIDTELLPDADELAIRIRNHNTSPIRIPAHPSQTWLRANCELARVEIWGAQVDGYLYPTALTAAFSSFFGREVRLVYKGPTPRVLRGNAAPAVLGRRESTKFADLMPLQVANARSIDELNGRLERQGEAPITIERFRPNVVVDGDEPWYEDVWRTVEIRSAAEPREKVVMDVVARCARCQVPNVDPETAVKHPKQPWDTLMSYRRIDEGIKFKPCFGMLCVPRQEGEVRVDDEFVVTEVTGEHRYIAGM